MSACSDDGGTEMGESDETTSGDGDGDGDATGDGDGDPATGDGDGDDPAGLSHAADIQPIWDANCIGCHSPDGSASFLDLTDGYAALVGMTSGQAAGVQLVMAGDSSMSYLVNKLMGTQADVGGVGNAMPPAGDPLGADDMMTITEWIDGGALP